MNEPRRNTAGGAKRHAECAKRRVRERVHVGVAAARLLAGAMLLPVGETCEADDAVVVAVTPAVPRSLAFPEDEIERYWDSRVVADQSHRDYIFIEERDIEMDMEMPEFVVTAWQYGILKRWDAAMSPHRMREIGIIDSLQPDLARDLDYRMRTEQEFFKPSPGLTVSLGPSLYDAALGRGR